VPAHLLQRLSTVLVASAAISATATAAPLTYRFTGEITVVSQNENNVIPNLAVGAPFSGYVTFESTGWHRTAGTIFAAINGVDLLFTGQYIYGEVVVQPDSHEFRVAGDTGGSITGSTFNAGNFGPELGDTDGSAQIAAPFPAVFDLAEFEVNTFLISGNLIAPARRVDADGRLTAFWLVPEPASAILAAVGVGSLIARAAPRESTAKGHFRIAARPTIR
jgi:hypothetical protein